MSSVKPALSQTIQGKAYEYSCLETIVELVGKFRRVVVIENSSLDVARNAWGLLDARAQRTMRVSSIAGIKSLIELEPKIIEDGGDNLELSLQEDSRGQEGDVRDIIILRRQLAWEIGISVKHNHDAIKHSRLSPTINFGKEWFGDSCTDAYFEEIKPIFEKLTALKQRQTIWREVSDKESDVYIPLLTAFMNELTRLDALSPGTVPAKLLEYLLGRKDFYKIIGNDASRSTLLQCFNIHGTLNTASIEKSPSSKVKKIDMPSKIYHLDFANKKGLISQNTVQLVMDNNWAISFRIHSASTDVETSLKFDIRLTGVPSSLFSNTISW